MSIEDEYKALLKRLKKESKPNVKAFSRRLRMPYNTIKSLVRGESVGNVKTWMRVEKFFAKQDSRSSQEIGG